MADYIVMQGGKPKHVKATAAHGLLWDSFADLPLHLLWRDHTSLPLIDPEKHVLLNPDERAHLDNHLKSPPEITLGELLAQAKRIVCNPNLDDDERERGRKFMNKEFSVIGAYARDAVLRRCAIQEPSRSSLMCKIASGNYAFGPEEIVELCYSPYALLASSRYRLFDILHQALRTENLGLSERNRAECLDGFNRASANLKTFIPDGPDGKTDPVCLAARWYGLTAKGSLCHMAGFFGGADHFFQFVHRRAQWKGKSMGSELKYLSECGTPDRDCYDAASWVKHFKRQLDGPYQGKDLFEIYPYLDRTWNYFHPKRSIKAGNSENAASDTSRPARNSKRESGAENFSTRSVARLLEVGRSFMSSKKPANGAAPFVQQKPWKRAGENAELAAEFRKLKFGENRFDEALDLLKNASKLDLIPDIKLDGSEFGCPGFELVKLRKNNPLMLLIGAKIENCDHIGGDNRKTPMVIGKVTEPDLGCYAIMNKLSRQPVVGLTAWLSEPDSDGDVTLGLTPWKSTDPAVDRVRGKILQKLADAAVAANPSIAYVLIGNKNGDVSMPFTKMDEPDPSFLPRNSIYHHKGINQSVFIVYERPVATQPSGHAHAGEPGRAAVAAP